MSQPPDDERPADGPVEPFASPSGPTGTPASPPPWGQDPVYGQSPPYGQAPYGQGPGPGQPPAYGTPAPYPAAGGYPGFGPPAVAPPNHGSATTSMVLGIISVALLVLTCACGVTGPLAIFTGPVAIWLGIKARREINEAPHQHGGSGQAMAGLVCGIIGTIGAVLVIAVIIFYVVIVGAAVSDYNNY